MDEERLSQWLIRQHRQLDEALQQISDGAGDLMRLREGVDLLRLHLWVEEEVLFDAVARTGLTMPIYIMQYEHAQMWPLLEELAAACEADDTVPAKLREPCRALYKLFQVHNAKEEDLIYTAVDRLAASEGSAIRNRLTAAREASMPAGWICRGRRDGFAPPPGAPPWPPGGRVV